MREPVCTHVMLLKLGSVIAMHAVNIYSIMHEEMIFTAMASCLADCLYWWQCEARSFDVRFLKPSA